MVQFKPVKPALYKPPFSKAPLPIADLPTEHDLPDSDNQPVDNELQLLSPGLLRAILNLAWADRLDWFFAVNMGLYYDPARPAVGPDAFLSLGAPHYRPDKDLRLSYLLWQEGVVPQWVLEIVSQTPGREYDEKMRLYAELGVSYYTIYNPKHYKRDKHTPFEVYKLEAGRYILQPGDPVWMPEIGLGIGVGQGHHGRLPRREWLYWYDEQGRQYPAPENVIEIAQQREAEAQQQATEAQQREAEARQQAAEAQRQVEEWIQKMRSHGIDPNTL